MTWTKLGEEWPDETRDLSDAAYRTHVDALCWSNRRLLDLRIPKRDLKRFAETDDPDTAVKELVADGWWEDRGDAWFIGLRFAVWQEEAIVVTTRREKSAMTTRRSRLHHNGDHSLCLPQHCPARRAGDGPSDASHDESRETSPGSVRNGFVRRGGSKNPSQGRGAEGPTPRTPAPEHERCPLHPDRVAHNCGLCKHDHLG